MRVLSRQLNIRLLINVIGFIVITILALLIRHDIEGIRVQLSQPSSPEIELVQLEPDTARGNASAEAFLDIPDISYEQRIELEPPPLRFAMPPPLPAVSRNDVKYLTTQAYGIVAGGGLGNQLFELISMLGIARTINRVPLLNPSELTLMQLLQSNILQRFDNLLENFEFKMMSTNIYTTIPFNRYCCRYDDIERLHYYQNSSVLFLQGYYFQSFKYFHSYKADVRKMLTPHWLALKRAESLIPQSYSSNFVICTHVRRGDFVSDGMHQPSDPMFTYSASEYLVNKYSAKHSKISLVVLGNDPLWAQIVFADRLTYMKNRYPLFFENGQPRLRSKIEYDVAITPTLNPEIDLAFSQQFCDVVLITAPTSTFGWWLGYVSKGDSHVYYRDVTQTSDQVLSELSPEDFYPPEWTMLRSNADNSMVKEFPMKSI